VPNRNTINTNYILVVLAKFLVHLRTKRPDMMKGNRFFNWDNTPIHTAAVVKNWLAAKEIQLLLHPHPPYSPDLALADFFLFRKVKEQLAGLHLTQENLKSAWEEVIRTICEDEFATAFRLWYERSEKCVQIQGDYVEKS
jgi:predicted acetyltransferase